MNDMWQFGKGTCYENIFAGDNFLSQMLRLFLQGENKKGSKFFTALY